MKLKRNFFLNDSGDILGFMKSNFLIILLLFPSFLLLSQDKDRKIVFNDRVYDPFFAAIIKDNEGEKFNVSRLAFYDEFNEKKFFFWVRRNSGLYSLSFKNIKRVTFDANDFADNKYKKFTRCNVELVTGDSFLVYMKTTGHLEGYDEVFGSPVTFYLHYNLIESIEFKNDGTYKYCPFDGTIFFDSDLEFCPFDGTPLIKGVLSDSDR